MQSDAIQKSRQTAYLAVDDTSLRDRIRARLEHAGWLVLIQPTGFHLLQSISDVIEDGLHGLRPGMIVIDAYARGCAGTTIAAGLRELGIAIPIVLVRKPGQRVPVAHDRALRVVDAGSAEQAVAELARDAAPSMLGEKRQGNPMSI